MEKLGRYEVAGQLATGGMAEVLLGRVSGPSGFERVVVLKRILPHLANQPAFVDMFLDEARIIARVHHPNVVNVHELCSSEGELFMVMEYLQGESVSSLLRSVLGRTQKISPRLAAFIVAEACAGLHAAHELTDEQGKSLKVVHRDVSPQNVFITFAGAVKVIDFGIAKATDRITKTSSGDVKGKLEYMAPEQVRSESLDRRTDVFALGIVLYELLTQRRLFKRPAPAGTLQAVLSDPIVPPSRIDASCPGKLEAICMRALERDPSRRYATALDMRRELMAFVHSAGSGLPEEELAALMQSVLSDRRVAKEEMLARIRDGSSAVGVPSPEAALDVEVPVVDATMEGTNAGATLTTPTNVRRRRWPLVALVAAAVGATAVVLATTTRHAPPETTRAAAPKPQPSESVATPDPPVVHVTLETDPAGATVLVDGSSVGTTPFVLGVPRSTEHRRVVLRKAGYADDTEDLVTDVDQKLRFQLKQSPTRPATRVPLVNAGARRVADEPPAKW